MKRQEVHTLILGAGPSGLAAGYLLAKSGFNPVVIEKDKTCGGLMRSIRRGDFVVDIGRKELYNRVAKVDSLWSEILGGDYRDYPHRGGILYDGSIIELSPAFEGPRRGMPWNLFLGCAWGFLAAQVARHHDPPRNLEEYFYRKRGRLLTQVFSQGFQEKLTGKKWGEILLPEAHAQDNGNDSNIFETFRHLIVRAFSNTEVNTYKGIWRHPAKGTGQICDALAQGITLKGGRIEYEARLLEMAASQGRIETVTVEIGPEKVIYEPINVVTSIPLEILIRFLFPQRSAAVENNTRALEPKRRTVVLVYLFLDEKPRFPHAWLQVTSPSTRIGRIANYTGFNGDMVPDGKTCLCCEYYCFGSDDLLEMEASTLAKQTLDDCARLKLVDPRKCFDHLVLKLPGADASQNRDNWMSKARLSLLEELKQFENLYYVNRTETDLASLAGMEAAEAILSGDRKDFDLHVDPARLQIRSEAKAFEFKSPVAV